MSDKFKFTDMERDVIGEVMNISLGSSATSLSNLLGKRVEITIPRVDVKHTKEFNLDSLEPAIGVDIKYIEGLDGVNLMVLKRKDAKSIVEILMGMEMPEFELDEINKSALCEVMNQMMGSASTALADFLGRTVNISTPNADEIVNKETFITRYFNDDDVIVTVSFHLTIEDVVESEFVNIVSIDLAKDIVNTFMEKSGMNTQNKEVTPENNISSDEVYKTHKNDNVNGNDAVHVQKEVSTTLNQDIRQTDIIKNVDKSNIDQKPVNIKPVKLTSFDDELNDILSREQQSNLELIMNVPLQVSVEIGKTKKKIKDILEFTQGTIVELDKQAGDLVDIIVNGQLVAKGEVVVVNDNFGIRVVDVIKKEGLLKLTV